MRERDQLEQLVKAIMQSGMAEARVRFWLDKIENEDFSKEDIDAFKKEFEEHARSLDEAVAVNEIEQDDADKEVEMREKEAVPFLAKLNEEQDAFYKKEMEDLKGELAETEAEMMTELENVRGGDEAAQMENIRKRLGNS